MHFSTALSLLFATSTLGLVIPRTSSSARATWLWNTPDLVSNSTAMSSFVSFAQKNGVSTAYVHIDPTIALADFENFMTKCSAASISVQALMGDPLWVIKTNDSSMTTRMQWIQQYQAREANNKALQIAGLHLDIEPWVMSGWKSKQASYIAGWEKVVKQLATWARAQSPALTIQADLPFWTGTLHSTNGNGTRLDVALLQTLDSATFMTYRNTHKGLLDITTTALKAAVSAKKSIYLGVTACKDAEAPNVSYYGMDGAELVNDIKYVENLNLDYVQGMAVDDYSCWKKMP